MRPAWNHTAKQQDYLMIPKRRVVYIYRQDCLCALNSTSKLLELHRKPAFATEDESLRERIADVSSAQKSRRVVPTLLPWKRPAALPDTRTCRILWAFMKTTCTRKIHKVKCTQMHKPRVKLIGSYSFQNMLTPSVVINVLIICAVYSYGETATTLKKALADDRPGT